jgi:hypothetical protein
MEAEEGGRGDRILLYFDRDPDQVHGMHRRGRSLANGSPGESSGNANGHPGTLSHTDALVWGHSAGMKAPGRL